MSFLVAEDSFDRLVREHPDCDVIVSLIGLPAELERVSAWRTPGPPRFALLLPDLRLLGNAAALGEALKSGKLAAFVLNKPGAPEADVPVGKNVAKEFARRFLLVTAENFEEVARTYPQLFPGE